MPRPASSVGCSSLPSSPQLTLVIDSTHPDTSSVFLSCYPGINFSSLCSSDNPPCDPMVPMQAPIPPAPRFFWWAVGHHWKASLPPHKHLTEQARYLVIDGMKSTRIGAKQLPTASALALPAPLGKVSIPPKLSPVSESIMVGKLPHPLVPSPTSQEPKLTISRTQTHPDYHK